MDKLIYLNDIKQRRNEMKSDELKAFRALNIDEDETGMAYPKAAVDAAIDEMKDKINQKDFFWDGCGFSKMGFKNTIDVANYIDELKKERDFLAKDRSLAYRDLEDRTQENMKLKAENEKLNTRLSESAMKVYKHHNKQTLRALWLARAKRAADRARIFYFCDMETELDIEGFSYDSQKKKGHKKLAARLWRIIWLKVERKCRSKAEEYK